MKQKSKNCHKNKPKLGMKPGAIGGRGDSTLRVEKVCRGGDTLSIFPGNKLPSFGAFRVALGTPPPGQYLPASPRQLSPVSVICTPSFMRSIIALPVVSSAYSFGGAVGVSRSSRSEEPQ